VQTILSEHFSVHDFQWRRPQPRRCSAKPITSCIHFRALECTYVQHVIGALQMLRMMMMMMMMLMLMTLGKSPSVARGPRPCSVKVLSQKHWPGQHSAWNAKIFSKMDVISN